MDKIIDISELIPDNENANKGSEFGNSLIEKSLRKFGAGRSILLDKNNKIVAGNKTIENAASIGLNNVIIVETDGTKLVAVKRNDIDLNTNEGREMALADNASAKANITWDDEVIEQLNEKFEIDTKGWGVECDNEFNKNIIGANNEEVEAPENVKTSIKQGEIYQIGSHRLACGDISDADLISRLMDEDKADLVITDPPYNLNYRGGVNKKRKKIANDFLGDSFYDFLLSAFSNIGKVSKKGAAIYVFYSPTQIVPFARSIIASGWLFKQELIWVKNHQTLSNQDYQWIHEGILYGWLDGGSHKWYSGKSQRTVLHFDRPKSSPEPPTMKPIDLICLLIKNSSAKGDIVVDGFGGSGTTMVACEQMGRNARMVEIEPTYCQVIIDRMKKLFPIIEINKIG